MILLHGLFSDANMNWIKFGMPTRIAAEGFRVIMPDHRAHGLSGKPHEPDAYPKGILARDLRELVAHLGLSDFDLGGFSLGARTTVQAIGEGMRPRRAILGGMGSRACQLEAPQDFLPRGDRPFDTVQRGDPHWLAIQFMKTRRSTGSPRRSCSTVLRTPSSNGCRPSPCRPWSCAATEDEDNGSAPRSSPTCCPMRLPEVPGTHMSSITKPEFGEAIARFSAA